MRGIGLLVTALTMTVVAHLGLPLPASDPLRVTVVLLPTIVAALIGLEAAARERGCPATPQPVVMGEVILLALLVLLTLARTHLGLTAGPLLDRCLAGGFVLLLMHRIAWIVASLLRVHDVDRSPRPGWIFLALPLVFYLAILPWTTTQRPPDGDAPHYLLLTHSLAWDFDTDLRNNYEHGDSLRFMDTRLEPQHGDPTGPNGELYSRHNILLPLLLAPFYRLLGLTGTLVVMAALTSLTAWLTLWLARWYRPDRPTEAILAWGILAFTAPFVLFSYQVWVEIPAALTIVLGWLQIIRLREQGRLDWKGWLALSSALLLLPLLKIRFLLIAVPLGVLAIWYGGRRSRRITSTLLLVVLGVAAAILWFNTLLFNNPLKYHDIDGLLAYTNPVGQYVRGFVGLFFDCAFGLFASAPIWALSIPAAVLLVRRRDRLLVDIALIFLPYLLALAPRGEWFGGWSPPFRYGVVLLPFIALALVPLFGEPVRNIAGKLVVGLAAATLMLTVLWLVVPGWTFNLATGRNHLLDLLSANLTADVARFFPSSTRPRAATFIWPAVAIPALAVGWWIGRRRAAQRSLVWGVVIVLAVPALVVWSARNRATRVVEFEDPWLEADSGAVYPDLWVVYRPRYRGGWRLPTGGTIEIPLVAGGKTFDIELAVILRSRNRQPRTLALRSSTGETLSETKVSRSGEWLTLTMRDVPCPSDALLYVVARSSSAANPKRQPITLDRATFTWK